MTPDELPADMEAIVSEWLAMADEAEVSQSALKSVVICQTEINFIRALLLAYQERGRVLEAASPVVPVGVSREEIVEIIEEHVFADDATEFTGVLQGIPEAADAIIATLRPTDTGRE